MNIFQATASYEKWMAAHCRIVRSDLRFKHEQMTASLFSFFRGTFYRWLQLWQEVLSGEFRAPRLLAVGDLHVENFGTWRDAEGRLIWGVNDFDEAYPLPYTLDLVRLAASAHIATAGGHLAIRPRAASGAILDGYREAIEKGGRAYILGEHHRWLRLIATSELRDPVRFWQHMVNLPRFSGPVPGGIRHELQSLMPEPRLQSREKQRRAGLGSLGHPRLLLIAHWVGALVAREAKALTPSASVWFEGRKGLEQHWYHQIVERAVRVPDPFLRPRAKWLLRRLAPDCTTVELASLPDRRDEEKLLHAMGWETANIHFGSPRAIPAIRRDLAHRKGKWLHHAARAMAKAVRRDWEDWRRR
jgi:hypothetical protein